jgi:superfamily II DNA or RNA helicase
MSSINRFSSRRERLDKVFLADRLKGAKSYKRIAGYFRSSIFELVDEEIAAIPVIRIVCNSELDPADIAISRSVRDREAALKERWNQVPIEVEALLYRDRYRKLYELLSSGRVEIRVVSKSSVFLHGKAGIIESADGVKCCFLGSINETKSAFSKNYEILWEDRSPEGIQWVEEEFDALWEEGFPLPEAIIEEIKRVSERVERPLKEIAAKELPAASLVESPLYRGGEQLQPWQRAFVAQFLEHREIYGKARLLLADEVGLGKTLSLAASAMVSALLDDGPVLILCPSTLTLQWQTELYDRLGIPSAVWLSNRKMWVDPHGRMIKTRGAADVACSPYRLAIVSTGLILHNSPECEALLGRKYGTIILDEAHKARRVGGLGEKKGQRNNLLKFMIEIASKTKHLLLGTATPIQTEVNELWDLLEILDSGADFVLGKYNRWSDWEKALPYVKGESTPESASEAWEWLRSPLPPMQDNHLFAVIRSTLGIADNCFCSNHSFKNLGYIEQEQVRQTLDDRFFSEHNPVLRHTVLRRRDTLENKGLLDRIEVNIHPKRSDGAIYSGQPFFGLGLQTNHPFDLAYRAAEEFTKALSQRSKSAGFMKTLLLQRICSSFASGRLTAEKMLQRELLEDEEEQQEFKAELSMLTPLEASHLERIVEELSRPEASDPKLDAVKFFLTEQRSEGRTWLEHGCIVFSQYYDTAYWIASQLAIALANETVAVYAGVGKSGLFKAGIFNFVEREEIKKAVKSREIKLVIATDAACEGLNLQTLGTLINIDLPWNPSRLEQRLGRIKRFGQTRKCVDMLNLVYHDTQDEKIYEVLSRRLKDKFDLFGGLPDTIEDDWIGDQQQMEEKMNYYIHLRQQAKNAFELKAQSSIEPDQNRWELCSQVLSRKDILEKLSKSW